MKILTFLPIVFSGGWLWMKLHLLIRWKNFDLRSNLKTNLKWQESLFKRLIFLLWLVSRFWILKKVFFLCLFRGIRSPFGRIILFDTENEFCIIFLEMQEHTKVTVFLLDMVHRFKLYFDKKIKSWTSSQISLIEEK